jgi:hypothetical protein
MKKLVIILSVISLVTISSCKQETDVNALLKNAETRSEILNGLAGNHESMTEFMEVMMKNNHAKMMMQGNKGMINMMMQPDHMQMMKDSIMMHAMMGKMVKDGNMMHHMMQMMHKEGMMSSDCMQSCMKKMGDKAMMMMDGKSKEDPETHNH